MAICKALVVLHGGKIWARNVDHSGSEFAFNIPKWLDFFPAAKVSAK